VVTCKTVKLINEYGIKEMLIAIGNHKLKLSEEWDTE